MIMKTGTRMLRSMTRAMKVQQRSVDKFVNNLFGLPKARPKTRQPALRPAPAQAPRNRPAPVSASLPAHLPGKWLTSYYAAMSAVGTMRRMSYCLYLADQAPPQSRALQSSAFQNHALPLIVMLHGCEQTASEFAQGTRMNRLAERKGCAVLYPQQSFASHSYRCWKWFDKATQQGGGDVTMIVGMIEHVAAKYAIDRSRIYLCGISAGAGMANIVALTHPYLIAALGLHSGPVFGAGHGTIGALSVMRNGTAGRPESAIADILARNPQFPDMPTILIHGADDTVVRPVNQQQLVQQSLLLNRLPGDTVPTLQVTPARRPDSRNPVHAYATRDFYAGKKLLIRATQIEQLGHAWSGGDASLSFNAKTGPDASKMMLDFFVRHQRC